MAGFYKYVLLFAAAIGYLSINVDTVCFDMSLEMVYESFQFVPRGDDPCLACWCVNSEAVNCTITQCVHVTSRTDWCAEYVQSKVVCCAFHCVKKRRMRKKYKNHKKSNHSNIIKHKSEK